MKLIEDFNEVSSLEFLTATQIAITIWNRNDIVRSLTQCLIDIDIEDTMFQELISRVKTIIQRMVIPPTLRRYIDGLITPIGCHIKVMRADLYFSPYTWDAKFDFPVSYWTSYGTADTTRLKELLMRDNTKDIGFRYTLACEACIETVAEELLPQLTINQIAKNLRTRYASELSNYWTYRLIYNLPTLKHLLLQPYETDPVLTGFSPDQLAFYTTVEEGKKSGIEYFLNHLRPNDSEYVLQKCFLSGFWPMPQTPSDEFSPLQMQTSVADALYFLMVKMSENLRNSCIRARTFDVWNEFITWPFYGLFCKHANEYINNYTREEFFQLIKKIVILYLDMYFLEYKPFGTLWRNCSQTYKDYVLNRMKDFPDFEELYRNLFADLAREETN